MIKDHPATQAACQPILVVDDDTATLQLFSAALCSAGFPVVTATSGPAALDEIARRPFGLLVLDLRLPGLSGLEVVEAARGNGKQLPFILISGHLTVAISVDAMKHGAADVLEKPIPLERLISAVTHATRSVAPLPRLPHTTASTWRSAMCSPGSAAERWAVYVVKAREAEGDLKTLEDWARFVAVGYTTLCESCRMIGVAPHDARDLMRTLRALMKSTLHDCSPEYLLDVSDRRTLKNITRKAGQRFTYCADWNNIDAFLATQEFVNPNNIGVVTLRGIVRSMQIANQRHSSVEPMGRDILN